MTKLMKPTILALDVSKAKTGWAFWDLNRHHAAIVTGSFKAEGSSLFETIDNFHPQLTKLLKELDPDYVVFEEGMANIPTYESERSDMGGVYTEHVVNAQSSLVLQRLLGDVQGILRGFRKPHESVLPATWRKTFLGYGRKTGFKRADYKRAAKAKCEEEGINGVSNQDEAEAAGIAYWAGIKSKHLQIFTDEFQQRNTKPASADLSGAQA